MYLKKLDNGNILITLPKDLIENVPPDDEYKDGKKTILKAKFVLAEAIASYSTNLKGFLNVLKSKRLMDKFRNVDEKINEVEITLDEFNILLNSLANINFTPVVFQWEDFIKFLEELEGFKP